MITSMNQSELYKTLVGHYKTSHYTYFPEEAKSGQAADSKTENKKTVQIGNVSEEEIRNKLLNNKNNLEGKRVIDLSNDSNMDRFEHSQLKYYTNDEIGIYSESLKELPYDPASAVDFMSNGIRSELGEGCENGVATKERIAEYYGAMTKRLDEAYAEGKFTKDEYDELNEMITNQIEKEAEVSERKTAFYALGQKRYSLPPEEVAQIVKREKSMTPEERLAAREKEIQDYVERYCKIDRLALMQLFSLIRYGK